MISCKQAMQLVSEGLDRGLSVRARMRLAMHLLICGECRLAARQLRALRALAQEKAKALGNARLSEEERTRIRARLQRTASSEANSK